MTKHCWRKSKKAQLEIYMCLWVGRLNTGRISILPKVIYRVNTIPTKIPMAFFLQIKKIHLEFQGTLHKTILKKKNSDVSYTFWFQNYKATVSNIMVLA